MQIVIYDPLPSTNTYLSTYYFEPLYRYLRDTGRDVRLARGDPHGIRNSRLCIDATNLGRFPGDYPVKGDDEITRFKNNGNKLLVFDINDHSSLGFWDVDISPIDFIFKVAGIQVADTDNELDIGNDLSYRLYPREFLAVGGGNYTQYHQFRAQGKFMSLPYPLDDNHAAPGLSYQDRVKKCLVRGGAHFKRVLLFFHLLRQGLADNQSAFDVRSYPHLMCGTCADRVRGGSSNYHDYKQKSSEQYSHCNNPAAFWWQELPEGFFNQNRWAFNNRCHPLYYWLTDKFTARWGGVDVNTVSEVFNGQHLPTRKLSDLLGRYLFYGDFKWIHSIYAPQRFWAAARCRTINLLPRRAASQTYFPDIREGDHFLTFNEDFSDLEKLHDVRQDQWEHITSNCWDLYHRYMAFGKYPLSTNLMDEIIQRIEA